MRLWRRESVQLLAYYLSQSCLLRFNKYNQLGSVKTKKYDNEKMRIRFNFANDDWNGYCYDNGAVEPEGAVRRWTVSRLTQPQSWVEQKNHGGHGAHGEEGGKCLMEGRLGISSGQIHPRDPRVPRGWASFWVQLKTGINSTAARSRVYKSNQAILRHTAVRYRER